MYNSKYPVFVGNIKTRYTDWCAREWRNREQNNEGL